MELAHLNSAQIAAVQYSNGPLMILAGAGSGKTRTLVAKISYLLDHQNYRPHEILALTFSNKAALEMRERVVKETGVDEKNLQVTTFHSFCARLLRREATYLGLSRNFVIYDESESREIIKAILLQHHISLKETSPYEVAAFIEELKNNSYYSGQKRADSNEKIWMKHQFYPFYQEYEAELRKSNAVDFGGLIIGVLQLFEQFPEVKTRYQNRYRYILVDEYQDTNRSQFDLMVHLTGEHQQICVVGDEDQSIYSWRGANIHNIFDFQKLYPHFELIKLEQNYRSTKSIISAASAVIAHNNLRSDKKLWTDNPEGESIDLVECEDDEKEGEWVAATISKLKRDGESYDDMAVFYRNNAQSRLLEEALRRSRIPYRIVGGIRFYERKEIKDVVSYLKLIVNPKDSLALSRIINVPPRGVGATTLRKLETEALHRSLSLWEVMKQLQDGSPLIQELKIGPKIVKGIIQFTETILQLQKMEEGREHKLSEIYQMLLEQTGVLEFYKMSKDYESLARIENLQELFTAIKQYENHNEMASCIGFLEQITLDRSQEEAPFQQGEVSLMTIHGAKGLEFPYVFVTGVEENIFPSYRSLEKDQLGVEEERRLFYVAMTRAMKYLHITFTRSRMLYGKWQFNEPSRFLSEIPSNYYRWKHYPKQSLSQSRKGIAPSSGISIVYDKPSQSSFHKGQSVRHALYGRGKIVEVDGRGKEEKVVILFGNGDKKRFLTQVAPLFLD